MACCFSRGRPELLPFKYNVLASLYVYAYCRSDNYTIALVEFDTNTLMEKSFLNAPVGKGLLCTFIEKVRRCKFLRREEFHSLAECTSDLREMIPCVIFIEMLSAFLMYSSIPLTSVLVPWANLCTHRFSWDFPRQRLSKRGFRKGKGICCKGWPSSFRVP